MRIRLESVPITDLDQALAFYTEVLGFVKKQDVELNEGAGRLLTVVSAEEPDAAQLLLEPNGEHPATQAYKSALYSEGIPVAAFEVDDMEVEYARLVARGVEFRGPPRRFGDETMAVLDDTCGNWLMIYEVHAS